MGLSGDSDQGPGGIPGLLVQGSDEISILELAATAVLAGAWFLLQLSADKVEVCPPSFRQKLQQCRFSLHLLSVACLLLEWLDGARPGGSTS